MDVFNRKANFERLKELDRKEIEASKAHSEIVKKYNKEINKFKKIIKRRMNVPKGSIYEDDEYYNISCEVVDDKLKIEIVNAKEVTTEKVEKLVESLDLTKYSMSLGESNYREAYKLILYVW